MAKILVRLSLWVSSSFFGVSARIAAGVKEAEISYQLQFSKPELRKVRNSWLKFSWDCLFEWARASLVCRRPILNWQENRAGTWQLWCLGADSLPGEGGEERADRPLQEGREASLRGREPTTGTRINKNNLKSFFPSLRYNLWPLNRLNRGVWISYIFRCAEERTNFSWKGPIITPMHASVADPGWLSRILIFIHLGSLIPVPATATKG